MGPNSAIVRGAAGRCVAGAVFAGLLGVAGCSGSNNGNPTTISDTTGATFTWTCNDNGCDVTPSGSTPSFACGGGYAVGRLLVVGPFPSPELGRAVVCAHDSDCPQFAERGYLCRAGLCESKDAIGLTEIDDLALCLASALRLASCHEPITDPTTQAALALVNQVCAMDFTCPSVPASCRQL